MERKYSEVLARLKFTTESDALDFQRTGRMPVIVEDGMLDIPLPAGPQGPPGSIENNSGEVFIKNVTTEPVKPVGGVVIYAQNGQLKVKNPSGTVKVLA